MISLDFPNTKYIIMKLIRVHFLSKPKSDSYNEPSVLAYMYFENDNGIMGITVSMSSHQAFHFPYKVSGVIIEYAD